MNPSPHDLSNPSFLQKLALDLIRSRKSNYLEDCIYYHLQESKHVMEDIPDLYNKYHCLLKCTFVRPRLTLLQKVQQDFQLNKKSQNHISHQKCIVYLHGLGSNRIQAFSILPHLPKNYSLFTFDLSGSGKSQGEFTTYGFRQKQDIESILMYLYKNKHIRQFIIWGRSMGAVASLLFNNLIAQRQTHTSTLSQSNGSSEISMTTVFNCVKCIIADSPFSSFEEISKDIALKKMSIPTFFTQIALKFLQNSFEKLLYDTKVKQCFTPFQIDFTKNCLKPVVPIIFVYSLNDEIVNCEHSEKIIRAIDKSKSKLIEKVIIPDCGHNLKRPENVFQVIFQKIQKHCLPSRQTNSVIEPKKHQTSLEMQENQQTIQKHTKSVRRKSFWNFEQQIQQNAKKNISPKTQNPPQPQSYAHPINKFVQLKPTNEHTRKSIFNRQQKDESSKMNTSTAKKRGLSLSSTIERAENPVKQLKITLETTQKTRDTKNLRPSEAFSFIRPMSVQHKTLSQMANEQESKAGSPRKGIARCNAQIMNQNFTKSSKNRPSLGGNKPRISLGGSVDKKGKLQIELFKTNAQCKILSRQNERFQMAPERDSSNPNTFSTISYSDQAMFNIIGSKKPFQTINLNSKQAKTSNHYVQEHFDSEPNITKEEELDLKRISSRQSINTIDERQLGKEIDESLSSFINNRLQFGFEPFNLAVGGFNKFKTISPTSNQDKGKESMILSEIDIKQVTEITQNYNKISTITIPTHTLRPSSRLYHEKKKKKLQAHTILINKQNQNAKMSNEIYLNDD